MMFHCAIGFDGAVIPQQALRFAVLSAIEAAMVMMFLFRAEALTPAGRMAVFAAVKRFMGKMLQAPFKALQQSNWAIFKFHSE